MDRSPFRFAAAPGLRLIVALFLLALVCGLARATLALPDRGERAIDDGWSLLADPGETLTPEQLATPDVAARFVAQHDAVALGFIRGAAWLRITTFRPASAEAEWWLELRSPLIDEATLYFPQADGRFRVSRAGDRVPRALHDLDLRNPTFRLSLPADRPVTFYVRIKGHNSMSFGMRLWTPERYVGQASVENLWIGLLLAIHLVLLASNLWFYQATRDPSYGFFSLFAATNTAHALCALGLTYRYLLPDLPALNEFLLVVTWVAVTPSAVLFVLWHLGWRDADRPAWTRHFFNASCLVAGLFAILMSVEGQAWVRPAHMFWQLAVVATLFGLALRKALAGSSAAAYLGVALGPLLLSLLLRFLRNTAGLAPDLNNEFAYAVGVAFCLLVMNFALSRSYRKLRREKENAQAVALELLQMSERELEASVVVRTRELQESMRQVQASLDLERQAQAEQDVFLATISHELRTPLAIIDAAAQNLELDADDVPPATRARYEKILRASERLSAVMENYLDDGYLTFLRRGVQRAPCNLREIVREVAESVITPDRQHRYVLDVEGLPRQFVCDANLTRLALLNLVENAVKYTPAGTLITLRGRRCGRRDSDPVELEVADDGPGVPDDEIEHVFEPRFRGANSTGQPGTGMGLTLARRMIDMQLGKLSLANSAGDGCCFRIVLPAGVGEGNARRPPVDRRGATGLTEESMERLP